ncbi:MAG: Spy/CpxP family protein refolding chaperone [Chitinispirillaceae bacterium]|jgi:Spy/CpxP family protein refolding chaperone|nr:Spy/CpxP family protein refolding chaperone [Chitinispirillaceae bacterium]
MKFKVITLALLAGALCAFATPDTAAGQLCCKEKGMGQMCKSLNLKDDQKTKLKELHKQMREAYKPLFEKLKGIRQEIKKELLKPAPSKELLAGFAAQIGDVHKQLAEKRTDHLLKVKVILTAEQLSKLLDREEKGPACGMKGRKGHCPKDKMDGPDAE